MKQHFVESNSVEIPLTHLARVAIKILWMEPLCLAGFAHEFDLRCLMILSLILVQQASSYAALHLLHCIVFV